MESSSNSGFCPPLEPGDLFRILRCQSVVAERHQDDKQDNGDDFSICQWEARFWGNRLMMVSKKVGDFCGLIVGGNSQTNPSPMLQQHYPMNPSNTERKCLDIAWRYIQAEMPRNLCGGKIAFHRLNILCSHFAQNQIFSGNVADFHGALRAWPFVLKRNCHII